MSNKHQFVIPPSASLLCPICQDVYVDPVITSKCHHSFCAECIRKSLSFELQCPLCRGRLAEAELHPNLALHGLVGELLVFCPFKQHGCQSHLRMESVASHELECGFAPSSCQYSTYGCEFTGVMKEVADHTRACPYFALRHFIVASQQKIDKLEQMVKEQTRRMDLLLNGGPEQVATRRPSRIWPVSDIACSSTVTGINSGVTSIVCVDGICFSGAYDGKIRAIDYRRAELRGAFDAHCLSVWSLALDNNRLFSAGTDGMVRSWNIEGTDLRLLQQTASHPGKVYSLALLGNRIFSASSDKSIKAWSIDDMECIHTYLGHDAGVNCITVLPGNLLASAASDQSVKIWDLATGSLVQSISHLSSDALNVTYGSGMLYVSTLDSNITAYSLNDYSRIGQFSGHRWEVWQLQHEKGVLFSGSHDHTIKRWDIRTFQSTTELLGHEGYIHALALGDNSLLSGCGDKTIKLWTC